MGKLSSGTKRKVRVCPGQKQWAGGSWRRLTGRGASWGWVFGERLWLSLAGLRLESRTRARKAGSYQLSPGHFGLVVSEVIVWLPVVYMELKSGSLAGPVIRDKGLASWR